MFTGERVIPGEVEADLWNEHLSRYHFAALFAAGRSVLDAGCGTGYGTALLAAQAADALGFDIAPEAVSYAAAHYLAARFLIASADALPAPDSSIDLVTAFELIEHLPDWQALIDEAHRVLTPRGVLLVSARNQSHASEPGPESAPPRAIHGFELQGFQETLARVFPFVRILAQNHQECILFSGEQTAPSGLALSACAPDLADARFFLAVCSRQPVEIPSFAYLPSASNLLGEREHDLRALNSELHEARLQHATLVEAHRRLEEELNRQNTCAVSLDQEVDSLRTELSLTKAERAFTRAELAAARAQIDSLLRERGLAANSRWVRLGRAFNIGPDLTHTRS